jgi:hypothetical protein
VNVASLELCSELYELSGWGSQEFWWTEVADYPFDRNKWIAHNQGNIPRKYPAYDLGYLLRKLPAMIDGDCVTLTHADKWGASYEGLRGGALMSRFIQSADTPEDTAAKLAIELFKQGVLTKQA